VPPGGIVTIRAISPDGAVDTQTIRIVGPAPAEPAPVPEGSPRGDALTPAPAPIAPQPPVVLPRRALGSVKASRIGRYVAVSTVTGQPGRLVVSLRKNGRRIRGCTLRVRAGVSYACRIRRPRRERARLQVVVALRKLNGRVVTKRAFVTASSHVH
jgi:hypothetical protein